jgi:phosphoribosylamine---glycine ligase
MYRWSDQSAACIVLAAPGYPEKPEYGQPIYYSEGSFEPGRTWLFHAGTAIKNGAVVTAGGSGDGSHSHREVIG